MFPSEKVVVRLLTLSRLTWITLCGVTTGLLLIESGTDDDTEHGTDGSESPPDGVEDPCGSCAAPLGPNVLALALLPEFPKMAAAARTIGVVTMGEDVF